MANDAMMDRPKVEAILSSKPVSTQAAHALLSRFLVEEHQGAVAKGGDDELLIRLDAVCQSLAAACNDDKKAKKSPKKSAKKERKEKRRREKESTKKSKKRKTS